MAALLETHYCWLSDLRGREYRPRFWFRS